MDDLDEVENYTQESHFSPFLSISSLWSILFVLVILTTTRLMGSDIPTYTIINMPNHEELPRNFRMTHRFSFFDNEQFPSFYGLLELKASASGQFSQKSLAKILELIPAEKILLLDLRRESHGFVNGIAMSWSDEKNWQNKDKSLEQILSEEKQLLQKVFDDKLIKLYQKKSPLENPLLIHVKEVYSEEDLAQKMGVHYARLPVTDHLKPDNSEVDYFVELIKMHFLNKETDHWLHFHCSAGRGRSTTFMSMYDMMRNASYVSFEDILLRQMIIGGKNLTEPFDTSDWRYEYHFERLNFLIDFYNYCLENPNFEKLWSYWIKEKMN